MATFYVHRAAARKIYLAASRSSVLVFSEFNSSLLAFPLRLGIPAFLDKTSKNQYYREKVSIKERNQIRSGHRTSLTANLLSTFSIIIYLNP